MENEKNECIKINGKISYVSQNNWLRSLSIRENVLFGENFEKKFYFECLEKSELIEDFNRNGVSDFQGLIIIIKRI
jgi:hypothetical protein